jgi:hypothetical protein
MKTFDHNQLRDATETETATQDGAADIRETDTGVSTLSDGIADILNMRVGCWRAPVHPWTEPTAA